MKWTSEDILYLQQHYRSETKDSITQHLNRKWDAIKTKACNLGIQRSAHRLEALLDMSPVSMYWIGFLLADGHFSKGTELKLKLSVLDSEHLLLFASFIQCRNIKYITANDRCYVCLSASDRIVVPHIKERYQITNDKTYQPPNIAHYELSDDQFISLLVGYIDGDGNIRKNHNTNIVKVACHKSWLTNLEYFERRLFDILETKRLHQSARISNEYARIILSDFPTLKRLKLKAMTLNLPILQRKWDKIDLSYESITKRMVKIADVRYISIKHASRELHVAPITIKRWIQSGKGEFIDGAYPTS